MFSSRFLISFFSLFITFCSQADLISESDTNLCSDDFNRADSTSLGGDWEISAEFPRSTPPVFSIENQRAHFTYPQGTFQTVACKHSTAQSRIKTQFTLTPISTINNAASQIRSLLYAKDNFNAYACGFTANSISLTKAVNGTSTTLAQSTAITTLNAGTDYAIRFEANRGALTCTFDTVTITASDTTFSSGKLGLFAFAPGGTTSDFYFDDFVVEAFE